MLEFAWPWMFALLPLPIVVWWLLPPYRARQASVQVPFFERLAAATGQTPQRGAVVLQRRATQMVVAPLSSAPRNMNGKHSELFTWLG